MGAVKGAGMGLRLSLGAGIGLKLSLCVGFVVTFCSLCHVSQGQVVERSVRAVACVNNTDSLNGSLEAISEAFSRDPEGLTDFIFILDVSGSIDDEYYDEMLDFIKMLIEFAAIRFKFYIHPDRGRAQIITFDDKAKLQIATVTGRYVHACEFVDIVRNLERPYRNGKTLIHKALEKAFYIISQEVKNMLVVVLTDGEFNDSPSVLEASSNRLKTLGATIFTVGLGYYLDEVAKAEKLRMLASQDMHYACVEDWRRILSDLTGGRDGEPRVLWAGVTDAQQENCTPGCYTTGQTCGCNVAHVPRPRYGCVCVADYYQTTNGECIGCPKDTKKEQLGNEVGLCRPVANVSFTDGEMAGMFMGILLLVLLLLVLILLVLCCLRKRGRGNSRINSCLDRVYERLRGSQRSETPYDMPGAVIGDIKPPDPPPARSNPYIPEPRRSLEDADDYVNVSPNEYMLPTNQRTVHKAKASLFDLLAIYDVKGETVQTANKSRVSRPEMTVLLRALRNGNHGDTFALQSKMYEVKNANANNFLQAEEISEDQTEVKTAPNPAVMWLSNATHYVVIGVSTKENSDMCKSSVFEMGDKLRQAKEQIQ